MGVASATVGVVGGRGMCHSGRGQCHIPVHIVNGVKLI